eukprot:1151487-Prymnesium_polylepis.1
MCASARLGERFVARGRCPQLGPLPALNCGRLATWPRKSRGRRPGFFASTARWRVDAEQSTMRKS